MEAADKACKDAQGTSSIGWKTVAGSIKHGIDTFEAVEAANLSQRRYDQLSKHRGDIRAIILARQEKWLLENPSGTKIWLSIIITPMADT